MEGVWYDGRYWEGNCDVDVLGLRFRLNRGGYYDCVSEDVWLV